MKKVLSFVLAAVMVVSMFAGLQISSSALEPSGQCGENVYYTFEESTGTLTISGSGEMYGYDWDSSPFGENSIKTITISSGVTSIGEYAFGECSSLTSITIPNSVISIGSDAFHGCSGLTSITIPNTVTSIGSSAFEVCSSLTSVTIGNSVTSIGSEAFYGCRSLKSVTIPNSVTSIGSSAFEVCSSLTSVTIGNSVTSIGSEAFYGCRSLKSVTIPNSVTSIGDFAFYGCSSLTGITIPNSVTSIGEYTFYGCSSLTSVTIPNSVTSIGSCAFQDCDSLTSITIPNSVTSIGYDAFDGTAYYNNALNWENGVLYNGHALIAAESTIAGTYQIKNGTICFADSAFNGCSSLTSVTIPNSVTSIGSGAFYYCSSLTSITIPNSVTSIGYAAFDECYNLKDVFYTGTESQWNAIDIGAENDDLTDANIIFNYVPPHVHDYASAITMQPTCTEAGVKTFTCSCGDTYTEPVAALGHNYGEWTQTKAPTCTEAGEETRTCTRDVSHTETREVAALGHKFAAGEPYCQNGCGAVNPDYVPPHTHDYTSAITTQPTCTEAGVKTFTCACGDTYTEPVAALGHNYGEWSQTKAPTCTEAGEETRICTRDVSHTETREVAALGHSFAASKQYCQNGCGTVNPGYVPPHVHSYQAVVTAPKATALGYTLHTCSGCGKSYKDAYTAPTGKQAIKCKARTATAQTVYWNNVKTATGYQVQISTKDGKKWSTYATLKAGVTSYTFKNLAAGNNYKFRVRFYINAADGKNYFSPWSATLNSPTLPAGTTITKLTPAKRAFVAQWKNAAVNGYQVQYSLKANFAGAKTITIKNANQLKTTVSKLNAGKYYFVRIRTYKTIAKANYCSAWSKTYKVKTK